MTNDHREQARKIVQGVFGKPGSSPIYQTAGRLIEELQDQITSTLSSRDAEIKEVLEGLKAYRSECWCQPNGDDHSRDCLAARDLYAKLNSEAPAPTNTTPKRRRKSKRE